MGIGKILFILILTITVFCTGCTERSFDHSDNGTMVQVKSGDMVRINLAENPSTGFSWNATTTGDLVITRDGYDTSDSFGAMMGKVGGGGTRSWDLTIGKDRVQSFSAVYRRPWEPENRTIDRFEIAFTVT